MTNWEQDGEGEGGWVGDVMEGKGWIMMSWGSSNRNRGESHDTNQGGNTNTNPPASWRLGKVGNVMVG